SAHSAVVDARHPPADAGDDLVGDRVQGVRPVLGGGFAVVAGAEQDCTVAGGDRVVADVHHELVHAHGSGDGAAAACHEHGGAVGCGARHPVAVAEGYQGEVGFPVGHVAVPVGDAAAGADSFAAHQGGAECHGGPQARHVQAGDGGQPVGGDPGPHQVESGIGSGEERRRVGDVPDLGAQPGLGGAGRRPAEGFTRGGGGGAVGLGGGGEASAQSGDG